MRKFIYIIPKLIVLLVKGVITDDIARLVPLYHSLGAVRDAFVVPLVALAGTGVKRMI